MIQWTNNQMIHWSTYRSTNKQDRSDFLRITWLLTVDDQDIIIHLFKNSLDYMNIHEILTVF